MDFLILIKNGCDNLTATVSPSVDALGLHMVIALATIMLVWFGVQEALASAQGGPGFSMPRFISFFVLITFAYCFVKFYDSSIPGIGYSLKGFISGGTSSFGGLHRQRFNKREYRTRFELRLARSAILLHRLLSHISSFAHIPFRSFFAFLLD